MAQKAIDFPSRASNRGINASTCCKRARIASNLSGIEGCVASTPGCVILGAAGSSNADRKRFKMASMTACPDCWRCCSMANARSLGRFNVTTADRSESGIGRLARSVCWCETECSVISSLSQITELTDFLPKLNPELSIPKSLVEMLKPECSCWTIAGRDSKSKGAAVICSISTTPELRQSQDF